MTLKAQLDIQNIAPDQDAKDRLVNGVLSSIKSTIQKNLESGLPGIDKSCEFSKGYVEGVDLSTSNVIGLNTYAHKMTGAKSLETLGHITMAQQKTPETQATADIFYLTQLIEDDGSITLLKPQGEGAMAETNDTMENAPETDSVSTTEAVENTSATTEASASPANTAENTSSDSPVAADPNAAAPSSSPSFADTSVTPDAPGDLASLKTLAESAAALSSLTDIARKIQAEGPKVTSGQGVSAQNAGGYTVDGLMRELLKPLLKEWLDAHLPSLVKWLVTEQIEKMLQDQLGVAPSQTKPNPSEATGTAPDSGDSTDEALEAVEAIMDGADADTPPAEEAS